MKRGKSSVLIGLQYGDEGKARVLDKIIEDNQIVARFNGGANAGHSVEVRGKKITLHQIPSGIFYPDVILYIGSGCVLNPEKLNIEKEEISNLGIDLEARLKISGNCSLIQPHHLLLDKLFGRGVGTTLNGIGPAYSDQAIRAEGELLKNIKFSEYLKNKECLDIVRENLKIANQRYCLKLDDLAIDEKIRNFNQQTKKLERYLSEDPLFLEKQIREGKNIIFEGAQSVMLDCVSGIVPFVTSSRTLASAAYTGGDLSNKNHFKTIGIAKAIMSRVGNGPFISEFGGELSEKHCGKDNGKAYEKEKEIELYNPLDLLKSENMFDIGIGIRMIENEYGATTKRPRRIGVLDLVMLKQNCMLNGVDELYINKFDSLRIFNESSLPGIPVVSGYILNGEKIDYVPTTISECRRTKPLIEFLPKFDVDISNIRSHNNLPIEVKDIIHFIEGNANAPIFGIGVGKERDQFIRIR